MKIVNSGDNLIKEVVSCEHVDLVPNPLLSGQPNFLTTSSSPTYLVFQGKTLMLLCPSCLRASSSEMVARYNPN